LLVEKGLVDLAALDALIDTYEQKVGPRNGARVVARAGDAPFNKLICPGTAHTSAKYFPLRSEADSSAQ